MSPHDFEVHIMLLFPAELTGAILGWIISSCCSFFTNPKNEKRIEVTMIHERRGCTLLIRAKPQVLSRVWGLNVDDWRKEQGVLQKDAHDSPRRRNLPPPARDGLGPCPIGLESGKTSLLLVNTSRSMPRAILHLSAQAGCNTHVR